MTIFWHSNEKFSGGSTWHRLQHGMSGLSLIRFHYICLPRQNVFKHNMETRIYPIRDQWDGYVIMACTSGYKNGNLHLGVFEYAELKMPRTKISSKITVLKLFVFFNHETRYTVLNDVYYIVNIQLQTIEKSRSSRSLFIFE